MLKTSAICAALASSVVALSAAMLTPALAQPKGDIGEYSDAVVQGSILEPKPIIVGDDTELAGRITVPEGFKVEVVARELGNPRMVAVHQSGKIYITRRDLGDVIRLDDADGDGKYEDFSVVASRPGMHGIAFDGDTVYLVTVNDVYTAPVAADGSFGELTRIIDDLPDAGQHANRTLAIGPDDMLYITVGSTCNECKEPNPENATILRAKKDGTSRAIFASGLRNTIGFGWEPTSGQLYGADHGIDWLGDEVQMEELNHLEQGKNYGWPYVYAFSEFNPHQNPPNGMTLAQWAAISTEPELGYTPHAAPMQMAFYTGSAFPEQFQGDAFIAMRGSWNRRPPSGYEIARVDFEDGKPVKVEPFATGFLVDDAQNGFGFLGRPTGIAQTPDGALIVSDDTNGIVYRITYGDAGATETVAANTTGTQEAVDKAAPNTVPTPPPSDIAINLVDASSADAIGVTADFAADAMIPITHSADGHDASPPLTFAGIPADAKSLVVIVDDPDAAEPKPFTHWVLYDVPATTTELPEGMPTDIQLAEPNGAKQGHNSAGKPGYMGPRPPLGDPEHHYHFQVFALDIDKLGIDPGAKRDDVLAAIKGHVLAKGELVGTFKRPPEQPEQPQN